MEVNLAENLDLKLKDESKFPKWEESYPYPKSDTGSESGNAKSLNENEEEWDFDHQPKGERWQPVGAPNDDKESLNFK